MRMRSAAWAALLAAACLSCRQPADLPPNLDERVASPASIRQGRALYMRYCALCHGVKGDGHGLRASDFSTPPRDFTNQAWRASTSPSRVYRAVRDGVPGTPMPAWRALGDDRIVDLTAYILSIRPEE